MTRLLLRNLICNQLSKYLVWVRTRCRIFDRHPTINALLHPFASGLSLPTLADGTSIQEELEILTLRLKPIYINDERMTERQEWRYVRASYSRMNIV